MWPRRTKHKAFAALAAQATENRLSTLQPGVDHDRFRVLATAVASLKSAPTAGDDLPEPAKARPTSRQLGGSRLRVTTPAGRGAGKDRPAPPATISTMVWTSRIRY